MGVEGPLVGEAAQFGSGRATSSTLQFLATTQLEQALRDELHAEVMRLPRTDTRRVAWLSCDEFSSQWVSSWPRGQPGEGGGSALNLDGFGGREFGKVFSTYLGRESPAVRNAIARVLRTRDAGEQVYVPDSHASRVNNLPVCDPFGAALGSATLPGGSVTACHNGCAAALFDIIEAAGLRMEREPKPFTSLIPVGSLVGLGESHQIRPDAFVDVAMPPANPLRREGGRRPKV